MKDFTDFSAQLLISVMLLIAGFCAIWWTIGEGIWTLVTWIWEKMKYFTKEYTGFAITIFFIIFSAVFIGQTVHYKSIEIRKDLAYDSLASYCDSLRLFSTYEIGYSDGVKAAHNKTE